MLSINTQQNNPHPTQQHPTQLKNEKVNKFVFLLVQSSNNLLFVNVKVVM